jgi:replication factor C subunit 1
MRSKTSGDKTQIRLNYLPILAQLLTKPLKDESGIESVIQLMDSYYINREDWDSILEIGFANLGTEIPTKVKSGFTRLYNKTSHLSPFAQDSVKKSKSKSFSLVDDMNMPDVEEAVEVEVVDQEEDDHEEQVIGIVKKNASSKAKKKTK